MILGVAILIGIAVAWALGAPLLNLADLRLRSGGLVLGALALQLILFTRLASAVPTGAHRPLHVLTYVMLFAFLAANLDQPGLWLAGCGILSNATVIIANGGRMPVSLHTWKAIGRDQAQILATGSDHNNVLSGPHTHLPWLGDVFALPPGLPLSNALSVGDLLLVAGMTVFVYRAAQRSPAGRLRDALAPLRSAPFRRLVGGRASSRVGDWLTAVAVVSWLYTKTGSSAAVSGFLVARIAASLFGGVVAAPLLDRFPHFHTLAAVEASRALLMMAAVPLGMAGALVPVVGLVCLASLLSSATNAAAPSLVADLLPDEQTNAGNALHGLARTFVMAVGALAGGAAFAFFGIAAALGASSATFALAALGYSRFSGPTSAAPVPEGRPARRELVRALLRNRPVLGLTASFTIATAAMGLLNASLPAFFAHRFGNAHGYGYALAAIAAGLMCGESLTTFIRQERVARRSVGLAFLVGAAALLLFSRAPVEATGFLMLFLLGASDGTTEVVYETLFQAHLPRRSRAGIFAIALSVQNVGMVVGIAASPLLIALASTHAIIATSALGCLLAAVVAGTTLAGSRAKLSTARPVPTADQSRLGSW